MRVDRASDYATPQNASDDTAGLEWTIRSALPLVCVCLLAALTLFGNAMVLAAVAKYKRLQIPSNYILVGLAVADASVALFASWAAVAPLTGTDSPGVSLCMLPYCLLGLGSGVSLVTLGLVAYDRYAALVMPLKYHQHITAERVRRLYLLVWLYVLVVAFAPMVWFLVSGSPASRPGCASQLREKYLVVSQVVAVFAPSFLALVVCYCRVTLVARRHSRAISAIQQSIFPNSLSKNFHMFRGNKYSRTLLLIVGVFALTWGVFVAGLLASCLCRSCLGSVSPSLRGYWPCPLLLSSALNPWIYAHRNRDFKAAFSRLLRALCCRSGGRCCGSETSRLSDPLSRTNSLVGEFQHLNVLYNNADMVPATVSVATCQTVPKLARSTPRLIQHDLSVRDVDSVTVGNGSL